MIPGDFSRFDEESEDVFNPESGELMLGDIVISKDRVLAQAEQYGHSPKREIRLSDRPQHASSLRIRSHGRGRASGDGTEAA